MYVPVIFFAVTITFGSVGGFRDIQSTMTKRSDDSVSMALLKQMAAEQTKERAKILEKFCKMESMFSDVKKDLKERNTLLQDTKRLQQKILNNMKDTKTQLKDELMQEWKKVMNGFNRTINSMQSTTKKNKKRLETTERDIASMGHKITDVTKECSKAIGNLELKLVILKKMSESQSREIAFTAEIPNRHYVSKTSSRLVFPRIITNIGGGYNASDGTFYCPKDGLYLFDVKIVTSKDQHSTAWLMKNDQNILYVYTNIGTSGFPSASASISLALQNGDRIWIKGAGRSYHPFCVFTGILVK